MSEITRILTAIEQGDARSTDELLPLAISLAKVYSTMVTR